ncbi:exopolyphosphatase [Chitinophagales bacterium]|nr:exopolyphosphatase [Chitinophagales bacterium]
MKKLAAIDIGSNAMRLLINNVIEYNGVKLFKKVDIVRVPIRLGTEAFKEKNISEYTRKRLVQALHGYKHLIEAHEVVNYRGCATSAMREAKNGAEIIQQIKDETGIHIEIIDGKEEAEIIYANHIEKLIDDQQAYLYVDVGGGSTEITFFKNGIVQNSKSFNIGTIRILNDMISTPMWEELHRWLEETLQGQTVQIIGSGGNINKVAKISRKDPNKPLSFDYLNNYYKILKSYTYEERIIELDLNPDRADVIIPAMKIFTSIMKWSKAKHIYVPKIGLADGIIKELEKNGKSLSS